MKKMLRIILITYFFLVLCTLLYVPWMHEVIYQARGGTLFLGYSFVWQPPNRMASIDTGRLVIEIGILTCVVGMLFGILWRRGSNEQN